MVDHPRDPVSYCLQRDIYGVGFRWLVLSSSTAP